MTDTSEPKPERVVLQAMANSGMTLIQNTYVLGDEYPDEAAAIKAFRAQFGLEPKRVQR